MVKWLKELHVPKKIKSPLLAAAKKVEKDAWLMFQHQLVTVGIVTLWKEVNVTEIFGDLRRVWYVPPRLYMKLIPLLNIENVHSLLVCESFIYMLTPFGFWVGWLRALIHALPKLVCTRCAGCAHVL